jgi:signal transduction histidine kinase
VRRASRFGLVHLVVFVVVALVLNAQFTWWVIFSLRETRGQLDLERATIVASTERAALRLQLRAEEEARRLVQAPGGLLLSARAPFTDVRVTEAGPQPRYGWIGENGRTAFAWPLGRGQVLAATLDPEAPYRWLQVIDPSSRLVDAGAPADDVPRVAIGPPFERLALTPDRAKWTEALAHYRRRVFIVVGEGVLFVVAMVTAVALLWAVLRREGERERQHQNFVSAVTHELKTPIAGIRLALETVLSGRVDDQGRERFLRNAVADADRLSDLVQKVLEATRYAGGAHRLEIALGDLSQLVEEEVMAGERRAAALGVRLAADVRPDIQAPFDPEALGIVLSNLLENAFKYATGSPPEVRVSLHLERGEAILEVSDSGIGIDPRELEAIFRPFYRSGDEVTRRAPGTGIGLFVAREIAAAHGGSLAASSPGRGQGATFRLVLPGAGPILQEPLSE